jgi:2-polyprenyl-3-methyl-5-hydroxy-6-metoxy-1,4-benzoquinol methylase
MSNKRVEIYQNILESEGYSDFKMFYDNALSCVYRNKNKAINITYKNIATKGLFRSFEILKHLNIKKVLNVPKVYKYNFLSNKNVEYLVRDYIEGDRISSKNIYYGIENKIYDKIYEIWQNGVINGDININNILVNNKEIYFFDFDQSYFINNNVVFEESEDIKGNYYRTIDKYMNYEKLLEELNYMKIDLNKEEWMNNLRSTGINTSYYSWESKRFFVKGERDDTRIDILKNNLPKDFFKEKKVVDIGCNIGRMAHFAAENKAKLIIGYELDYNTYIACKNIVKIEKQEKKILIFNKDLSKEIIEHESFDIAFVMSVLWHINPREKLLKYLNENIQSSIIIEAGLKEPAFNTPITKDEDIWSFNSKDDMLQYLYKYLNNFVYVKSLGISERNREIFLLNRKDN